MFEFRFRKTATALAIAAGMAPAGAARAAVVDVELLLLSDTSYSISASEFSTYIRPAYAAAFNNAAIQEAIASGPVGAVAVQLSYWGEVSSNLSSNRVDAVPWRMVTATVERRDELRADPDYSGIADAHIVTASEFASLISTYNSGNKPSLGTYTHLADALRYGLTQFSDEYGLLFESNRRIIDVMGDGPDNRYRSCSGISGCSGTQWKQYNANQVRSVVDTALSAGTVTQVNGLAILGDSYFADYAPTGASNMTDYYGQYMIGGDDAFVEVAASLSNVADALQQKLLTEVTPLATPIPAPPALAALGLGLSSLLGLRAFARRRKA